MVVRQLAVALAVARLALADCNDGVRAANSVPRRVQAAANTYQLFSFHEHLMCICVRALFNKTQL